jgi:hypothetical protein
MEAMEEAGETQEEQVVRIEKRRRGGEEAEHREAACKLSTY